MSRELSNGTFDYSRIPDADDRAELMSIAADIGRSKRLMMDEIISVGNRLLVARQKFAKYGSGIFQDWMATDPQINYSQTTAYRFIGVAERFGKFHSSQLGRIDPTAAYELAKTESPKEAVKAAVKLADSGKEVTVQVAKDLIKKYKPEAPKEERTKEPAPTAAVTETRTDSGSGTLPERDLENCDHEWISDGNGERYCQHCKMDHPDDVKRPRKAAEPVARVHLLGIAKTIEHLRVKIDEICGEYGRHASTEQIMTDLDKALISLKKWAGTFK